MQLSLNHKWMGDEGAVIWIHDAPKGMEIKVIDVPKDGEPKVRIGNVDIYIFEEEMEDEDREMDNHRRKGASVSTEGAQTGANSNGE